MYEEVEVKTWLVLGILVYFSHQENKTIIEERPTSSDSIQDSASERYV